MKIFAKLTFFMALVLLSWQASAQATMPRKGSHQTMRDGVARKFGKMVEFRKGKEMPLTHTYKAKDGTKVSADGTITFANGTKEKLAEGFAVNAQGNKVILEDDMIAPDAIRKQQESVTGKSETTVVITEKTHRIVNDSTGRKFVNDTVRTQTTK